MAEANTQILVDKSDAHFEASDKVIIFGSGGVGKSFALATILPCLEEGGKIVLMMTERNSALGLERGLKHHKIEVKPGQLIYVFPKQKDKAFGNLRRALKDFSKESKKQALAGKFDTTQGKENYSYLDQILDRLYDFAGIDYATGEAVKIGNVGDNLTPKDVLIIDGLSPIGNEVWKVTAGDKIAIGQNDYMPAQNVMYQILSGLSVIPCHVVLLAHERHHLTSDGGIQSITVNTWVGNSNYETLMGLFTDVIRAVSGPTGYKWQISDPKARVISRRIPKGNLNTVSPSFFEHGFFK